MGGDIPGTYAPFPYPVLIVAIEGSAGYVILGVGDEDIFCIGMDHDPVRDTDVFLATVGDTRWCCSAYSRSIPYCNRRGNLR